MDEGSEFKSRWSDELNAMKTHSRGRVRGSRGFAQYFSSLRKSELICPSKIVLREVAR